MKISRTLGRRVLRSLLVVVGVSVAVFVVTHLIGDPVSVMLPLDATHEQYVALRHQLGLDHSLGYQFVQYFGEIARGHFGNSLWQQRPALGLAVSHIWPTAVLALSATLFSVVFGIPAGFLAAVRSGTAVDRAIGAVSIISVSIAGFWLALMLILGFAVELRWLPTSGLGAKNLVLPALAASAVPFGRMTQIARSAMIDELGRPYMRAARAKGMSTTRAVAFHATRNALIPVVTLAGYEFAVLIGGGLIIIETIFSWPGLGYLTFQALDRRDFPLIQTCVLLIAVIVVLTNLVVVMLYSVIDPRIRT
jgi:peptide/nickel transport system permease protein